MSKLSFLNNSRTTSLANLFITSRKMSKKEHLELTSDQFRDPEAVPAKIVSVSDLSSTVKGLKLSVDKDLIKSKNLSFKAGQWLDFFIPGENQVGGFSMSSSPYTLESEGTLDLAVKVSTWPPARWVHNTCRPGDLVTFRFGGDFYYPPLKSKSEEAHSLLLVAGGVGINPLYSILQHVHHIKKSENCSEADGVTLLYSAATRDELIFRQNIDKMTFSHHDIRSNYFVTREQNINDETVISRRITKSDLASCLDKDNSEDVKKNTICYLCGPPGMVVQIRLWLQELGVPPQNVKFELWW